MVGRVGFWLRTWVLGLWLAVVTIVYTVVSVLLWGNPITGWLYAKSMCIPGLWLLGVRIAVANREILDRPENRPAIMVANHQSNLDMVTLAKVFPRNTVVIGKKELWKVPFFGLMFKASGQVLLDRSDRDKAVTGLDKAVDTIRRKGRSIWIFPEGTRSKGRGLGRFKKGAFHMAVAAQVPVIPVVAQSLERVVDLGRKKITPGTLNVRVLDPIETRGLDADDVAALTSRVEDMMRQTLEGLNAANPKPVEA